MPQMLHLRGANPGGACFAIPSYGAMSPAFVYALLEAERTLTQAGMAHETLILGGHCHVDDARNSLVRQFLASCCTDLIFIDADVLFKPADLAQLLTFDRDIVAGVYPRKSDPENYPVRHLNKSELWAEPDGLLEVEGVPTGFLRIRRYVLELLTVSSRRYFEQEGDTTQAAQIFERITDGLTRFSGDYAFCRKARAAGFKIFIDPRMSFGHIGEREWTGCYGDYLLKLNGLPNNKPRSSAA